MRLNTKEWSRLTSTSGHSVHVIVVSVHVIVVSEVIPSVATNALQASVRDEQLVTVGGEITLSGNRKQKGKEKEKKKKQKKRDKMEKKNVERSGVGSSGEEQSRAGDVT